MSTTHGVVHIHSTPAALCPHVGWALDAVLDSPADLHWSPQPAEPGSLRAEVCWWGPVGTCVPLAQALRNCLRVRFEVTEQPTPGGEGQRISFTPDLGLFRAITAANGDLLIPEERLKAALLADARGVRDLGSGVRALLGTDWDEELEVFRQTGAGAPVRWLKAV